VAAINNAGYPCWEFTVGRTQDDEDENWAIIAWQIGGQRFLIFCALLRT